MSYRVHWQNGGSNQDIEGQYLRNNGVDVEGKHSNNDGAESVERRMPRTILDPRGRFLQGCNKILLVSCVIAVTVDPLFFYIPIINDGKRCFVLDKRLRTTVFVLRTVTDVVYLVHIIFQFRTAFIDKASKERGETRLITNSRAIFWRYLCQYFIVDILVVLPIPQVVYGIIFSEMRRTRSSDATKLLNALVLFQYVPRVRQIYISWKELARSSSRFVGWVKAAFNLFLYILASHVMGAFWYFFSIQRETACWHMACKNHNGCVQSSFSCANGVGNYAFLDDVCPINTSNSTLFDFGIFLEALQSKVVQSTNFQQKFFYCFWWGLRNLSSLGQNLQTSNYVWENCFAIFISLFGLMLFLSFIENLKGYFQKPKEDHKRLEEQSKETKLAEQSKAKGEIEAWTERHGFPDNIKHNIMQIVVEKLKEDIYVNVENLFLILPLVLKNDVNRHLYFAMLKKVPVLENMDEGLLLMICDSLKPVSYDKYSYIVREGEPIDTTFFITQGIAWRYTTNNNGEGTSSSPAECLEKGHFFGEELLSGLNVASPPFNLFNLPVSSKIVKAHTKVEALALMANDLKNIVEQLENDAAIRLQAA